MVVAVVEYVGSKFRLEVGVSQACILGRPKIEGDEVSSGATCQPTYWRVHYNVALNPKVYYEECSVQTMTTVNDIENRTHSTLYLVVLVGSCITL